MEHWADVLNVHDRSLVLARDVATQARAQAQSNFYRLFWMGEDPELAAQWRSLAQLPAGMLCGSTTKSHSFITPGELDGANAALAHHNWL